MKLTEIFEKIFERQADANYVWNRRANNAK